MKKPMKAALLSALLFPGAGHLFLKRYIFSALLIIPTLYSLYYIINSAIEKSMQLIETIQNGSMQQTSTALQNWLAHKPAPPMHRHSTPQL